MSRFIDAQTSKFKDIWTFCHLDIWASRNLRFGHANIADPQWNPTSPLPI